MGFVRKLTGVDKQVKATKQNARAQEEATKQAAADSQAALMANAKAAADQQAMLQERSAAEAKATAAASAPLETAEVALDAPSDESVIAARRKRNVAFGRNYDTGVNLG